MIRLTNLSRGPVQVMVRSKIGAYGKESVNSFSTLNIPGKGGGNNVIFLEDEKMTEYVSRRAAEGLIRVEKISEKKKIC